MSLIPRCVVCDGPVPNAYAPSPCCEGMTCPKERPRPSTEEALADEPLIEVGPDPLRDLAA